jgi:hypothetical protein
VPAIGSIIALARQSARRLHHSPCRQDNEMRMTSGHGQPKPKDGEARDAESAVGGRARAKILIRRVAAGWRAS